MNIFLPNSAHLQNIEGFLRRYTPQGGPMLTVTSHPSYIHLHPIALAMTACAAASAREGGHTVTSDICDVASIPYLVRMGLFRFLGADPPRTINEHEEAGRFIPITKIVSGEELKHLISELIPMLHTSSAVADPIRYVISELGRNVLEHSGSTTGAFACAQYFSGTKRIAIGIADSGIGILQSIRRSHPASSESEAFYLALTPGISGATSRIGGNETNAGAGLFFIKSIAKLSHNYFLIYSGNTLFKLRKDRDQSPALFSNPRMDNHSIVTDLPEWKGTVIGIDISVDEGIKFGRLLDTIRRSYSIDVKAKKKAFFKKIRFS